MKVYDFMGFTTLDEEEEARSLRTDVETDDPVLLRCAVGPPGNASRVWRVPHIQAHQPPSIRSRLALRRYLLPVGTPADLERSLALRPSLVTYHVVAVPGDELEAPHAVRTDVVHWGVLVQKHLACSVAEAQRGRVATPTALVYCRPADQVRHTCIRRMRLDVALPGSVCFDINPSLVRPARPSACPSAAGRWWTVSTRRTARPSTTASTAGCATQTSAREHPASAPPSPPIPPIPPNRAQPRAPPPSTGLRGQGTRSAAPRC